MSSGTSLVVQWFRIRLPMQGTWVRSLVRELRSHMPQGCQKRKKKHQLFYCLKNLVLESDAYFLSFPQPQPLYDWFCLISPWQTKSESEVHFDVETAIKVLRQAGYYSHALYLAENHAHHEWYLKIQLEDIKVAEPLDTGRTLFVF